MGPRVCVCDVGLYGINALQLHGAPAGWRAVIEVGVLIFTVPVPVRVLPPFGALVVACLACVCLVAFSASIMDLMGRRKTYIPLPIHTGPWRPTPVEGASWVCRVRLTRMPPRPRSPGESNPRGSAGDFAMSLARAATCDGEQWRGHAPEKHLRHSLPSRWPAFPSSRLMVPELLD